MTVTTDEAVRRQSPDLQLWVSDALDRNIPELDEMDTFDRGSDGTWTAMTPIQTNPLGPARWLRQVVYVPTS